jgi:hypothetical protein
MDQTLDLTPEEQDSLAIGEQMAEAEQSMLAGKFENAEQLEKAYLELQTKLGNREPQSQANQEQPDSIQEEEEGQEVQEEDPTQLLIMNAAKDFVEGGQISEDTLKQFDGMSSRDVIQAMMNLPLGEQGAAAAPDLSDTQVNQIKNVVGGEQQYSNLMEWASSSLPQNATQAFDDLCNTGSPEAIQLAVLGLQAQYQQANGYEGNMVTGRGARETQDVFRSQAEVVAAMADPRYDKDPAYREDVFNKLSRSDV